MSHVRLLWVCVAAILLLLTPAGGQERSVHYVFQPPEGWTLAQQDSSASLLTREGITGYILVLPNGFTTVKEFDEEMRKGLVQEGMCNLALKGTLQKVRKNMRVGDFEGEFQGKHARARVVGILSEIGGGGVYVMGVDAFATFSPGLARGTDDVARAIRFKYVRE